MAFVVTWLGTGCCNGYVNRPRTTKVAKIVLPLVGLGP